MSARCYKDARAEGRSVFWKKWAAKHEYEELKEGAWLEPGLTLLRKKVKENWTEKHRNVAWKIFLEGGWTQKRLFDIGWSDVSQCQACQMEEGTEKHRLHHYPEWYKVRRKIPDAFTKWKQTARMSKKEWKWQRCIVVHLLDDIWNRISVRESGSLRSTKAGACKSKVSGAMLLPMALCWAPLEDGVHVVGRWCSWIMMRKWCRCMGCMARWRQNMRCSAPSRGRS